MERRAKIITDFKQEYSFLSNLYPCTVKLKDRPVTFKSAEAAYQSLKSKDPKDWAALYTASGEEARRYGMQHIQKPPGWDTQKIKAMSEVIHAKFTQNPGLASKLMATGDAVIAPGSTRGDDFWGMCGGKGRNELGTILMETRNMLIAKTQQEMHEIPVHRALGPDTFSHKAYYCGRDCAIHVTRSEHPEICITDGMDPTRIYGIMPLALYYDLISTR